MDTIEEFSEESGYFIPSDEFKQKLVSVFAVSFDALFKLWSEIGITGELLRDRQVMLLTHHKNLQRQMIDEETKTRDKLRENLSNLKDELEILCIQLKIDSTTVVVKANSMTLLEQEAHFKSLVEELLEIKDSRMVEFQCLFKQEQELCGSMELRQKFSTLLFTGDEIPSNEVLDNLKQHIKELQKEKEGRFAIVLKLKKQAQKMMKNLEKDVKSCDTLQKQLLKYPDEVLLSDKNLKCLNEWLSKLEQEEQNNKNEIEKLLRRLQTLWELLEVDKADQELIISQFSTYSANSIFGLKRVINDLDVQRRASLSKCFAKVFEHLNEWWGRCKVAESDRMKISNLTEDDFTEEMLSSLQDELNKWKLYYEKNEQLFSKVEMWFSLWQKLLSFENKSNDKTRYHNRGGNLLKEERERRKLDKQLPKLECDINSLICDWEQENNDRFLIFGMEALEYFEKQKMDLQIEKENTKMQRQLKRTEDDKTFLGMAHTPSKRFCTPTIMGNTCTPKRSKLTPGSCVSRVTGLNTKSPASAAKNLHIDRRSTRLQTLHKAANFGTPLTCKTPKISNMGEYSVSYHPKQRKKQNTSNVSDATSSSSTTKNQVVKVIGSKVVKRYSNEAQRRRSLRSSTKNSISILQRGAKKLSKHLASNNQAPLAIPTYGKTLNF